MINYSKGVGKHDVCNEEQTTCAVGLGMHDLIRPFKVTNCASRDVVLDSGKMQCISRREFYVLNMPQISPIHNLNTTSCM